MSAKQLSNDGADGRVLGKDQMDINGALAQRFIAGLRNQQIIGTAPVPVLPIGLEDLFEVWASDKRSESDLRMALHAPDPFIRAGALFTMAQRGKIDNALLHDKSSSEDWPERLVAAITGAGMNLLNDHVHWVAICAWLAVNRLEGRAFFQSWSSTLSLPPLVRNKKDGSILALVPSGEFMMGDGLSPDCLQHRVLLDAFYIGVFSITNAQYVDYRRATGKDIPPYRYLPRENPVISVSWDDASNYAKWAECMLPTEAQWEKAARGGGEFIYPWGNNYEETMYLHFNNRDNDSCSGTAVWQHASAVSGYGTYQQAGNGGEWCSDWYSKDYYRMSSLRNPTGPTTGSQRVNRGGWWWRDADSDGRGAHRNACVPVPCHSCIGLRLVH
ncbi:MAG: SUMF1/EgtB/PvdO family nonheme iron enzyme, partial [bacterium]